MKTRTKILIVELGLIAASFGIGFMVGHETGREAGQLRAGQLYIEQLPEPTGNPAHDLAVESAKAAWENTLAKAVKGMSED